MDGATERAGLSVAESGAVAGPVLAGHEGIGFLKCFELRFQRFGVKLSEFLFDSSPAEGELPYFFFRLFDVRGILVDCPACLDGLNDVGLLPVGLTVGFLQLFGIETVKLLFLCFQRLAGLTGDIFFLLRLFADGRRQVVQFCFSFFQGLPRCLYGFGIVTDSLFRLLVCFFCLFTGVFLFRQGLSGIEEFAFDGAGLVDMRFLVVKGFFGTGGRIFEGRKGLACFCNLCLFCL